MVSFDGQRGKSESNRWRHSVRRSESHGGCPVQKKESRKHAHREREPLPERQGTEGGTGQVVMSRSTKSNL